MLFKLEGTQLARAVEWEKQQDLKVAKSQRRDAADYGTSGGGFTYMFTPTGLGIAVRVENCATGDTIDLTDYSSW